jgi:putative ABC transport system permease protein
MEVSANGRSRIRAAAFQVTNILTRLRGKQDFSVIANKTVQDLLLQITVVLSILLSAIASVSLVVGGIGIMNIMLVSVKERTQEIGLRKALGAPEQSILQQFLIEAVILSTAGGIIGISLGVSITLLIGVFTPLKPSVPISAIVLATGVSGGIGLIFGVIPARQAAKLDPVVALRST